MLSRFNNKSIVERRYIFPPDPSNGMIDLTVDDVPFYYNTHSGELSLDFPRAENLCRGGILAYVI